MGMVSLFWLVRDYCLIRAGRIAFRQDQYHSKTMRNDADGFENYYVNFMNGKTIWEKTVTVDIYEKMREGDVVDSAYLGRQKKPILSIYHSEDVF